MEIPVIEAKTALAKTVATPKPAVTRRSSRSKTSKVSRPTPEIVTSSPISTNSGTTAKRYSSRLSFATCAIIRRDTTSFRISATPAKETSSIPKPIGIPRKISSTSRTMAIGRTSGARCASTTVRPSTAESTEIAGVIMLSP